MADNQPVNVFVFIHGMRMEHDPVRPEQLKDTYQDFWEKLGRAKAGFSELFEGKYTGVEWGHANTDDTKLAEIREDKRLTDAQIFVGDRVEYAQVKADEDPNNVILGGWEALIKEFPLLPPLRDVILSTKEEVMIRGFGDAIYYSSEEGERAVRSTVYEQVLSRLDNLQGESDVRLHIFGHSLGVTVSHDFLYGLFAPGIKPDFIEEKQGSPEGRARFETWRTKAGKGELKLGTLVSSASQLPLFLMRKQSLVDRLARRELIDPSVLGIKPGEPGIKWLLFYDADDLLGFPTRRLYAPADRIREIQVSTGNLPPGSHGNYWQNDEVIKEAAELVYQNSL